LFLAFLLKLFLVYNLDRLGSHRFLEGLVTQERRLYLFCIASVDYLVQLLLYWVLLLLWSLLLSETASRAQVGKFGRLGLFIVQTSPVTIRLAVWTVI